MPKICQQHVANPTDHSTLLCRNAVSEHAERFSENDNQASHGLLPSVMSELYVKRSLTAIGGCSYLRYSTQLPRLPGAGEFIYGIAARRGRQARMCAVPAGRAASTRRCTSKRAPG